MGRLRRLCRLRNRHGQTMKDMSRASILQRAALPAVAGFGLLVAGCATLFPSDCARFEQEQKNANYATVYKLSKADTEAAARNFKALPRRRSAAVRLYKIRVSSTQIKPCNHLLIHKEVYFQRISNPRLVFVETREFYAEDGTLIANKREIVTAQLKNTGYYVASVSLPIPQSAPPGKYRIVSKLSYKWKGRKRKIFLAKSSTTFRIIAKK